MTILELLIVLALAVIVGASGLTGLRRLRQRQAGREAARLFMHDLQHVAGRARTTGRARGVVIDVAADRQTWQEFVDGNGNGVRMAEIAAGTDPAVTAPQAVVREGSARLAIVRTIPSADQTSTLPAGSGPVRFGISPLIVFTPRRTASSGSLYLAGPDDAQYAVRILGTTQRWRLLCLDNRTATWEGC